ncbi:hypothetical protein JXO59_16490 [candidate division KSB1 bacterium]|nr:hypothetical protein [candidate division KSB1 bacterium]
MENAFIQFDAHVHLYPGCDLPFAVRRSIENMNKYLTQGAQPIQARAWLLTERSDCHRYKSLADQRQIGEYKIERTAEKKALAFLNRGEPILYIMPGRQIVTREGLELCALITHFELPDRQYDVFDCIKILQEAGAVVALNWAPGKWFLKRGRIVRQIIDQNPGALFISDTTMRPTIWPTPRLMRRAVRKGFRLLYGSDPLPFNGEEKMFGSYGSLVQGPFSHQHPAGSLRDLLNNPQTSIKPFGLRSNTVQFAWRQYNIMQEKKRRD